MEIPRFLPGADVDTYELLAPTAANLAQLAPVIPPGFTRTAAPPVPLPDAAKG